MPPPPAEQIAARVFIGPALRAQPDRRLVDLVRDGYEVAFEEIVRRYRKPLDRFAAGIVGGRSEDVTQDAFSKALLALRGSEAEIELRPWLYRIVRNTALNDLRDRAPAAEELSERLPGARSAAAEVESREELRDLMGRLQALPEPQRAALVMRELEGLSHEEIAAALGVSGGAARQAIYRARAAVREGLGLLLPLPALRIFAEHGAEIVKAGAATVLIAGTVGTGVAIQPHRGGKAAPEAAEAAPLAAGETGGAAGALSSAGSGPAAGAADRGAGSSENGAGRGSGGSGKVADPSGPSSGSTQAGNDDSGGGSRHGGSGGPGPSSGTGSSGDRHGGDDGEASGGPATGSGEDGSQPSGGEEPASNDSSGDSEPDPATSEPEPSEVNDESTSGGSGDPSREGSTSGEGSGSGDPSTTTSSGTEETP